MTTTTKKKKKQTNKRDKQNTNRDKQKLLLPVFSLNAGPMTFSLTPPACLMCYLGLMGVANENRQLQASIMGAFMPHAAGL